jgi:hypothetical protein
MENIIERLTRISSGDSIKKMDDIPPATITGMEFIKAGEAGRERPFKEVIRNRMEDVER